MRLLVVRHGTAVAPDTPGLADADRPLTIDGARRFRVTALAIARAVPVPDVLLTSPLRRAQETAALLAEAWRDIVAAVREPALSSSSVDAIRAAVARHETRATVVLVGHEPTLPALVAELMDVDSSEAIAFAPGAAALLDVTSTARGGGRLVWFLPPVVAQ